MTTKPPDMNDLHKAHGPGFLDKGRIAPLTKLVSPAPPQSPKVDVDAGSSRSGPKSENPHPADAWPKPPDRAAYSGLAGEWVRLLGPHTEADPVALLVPFLVAFGSVVGRGPFVRVESDHHHTNTNVCLVGVTSKARKGTSWGRTRDLLKLVDESWAKSCVAGGLSSGEGLIWRVRDEIWKDQPVKEKGRIVDYERVMIDSGVEDKRLLVVETELASTLRV